MNLEMILPQMQVLDARTADGPLPENVADPLVPFADLIAENPSDLTDPAVDEPIFVEPDKTPETQASHIPEEPPMRAVAEASTSENSESRPRGEAPTTTPLMPASQRSSRLTTESTIGTPIQPDEIEDMPWDVPAHLNTVRTDKLDQNSVTEISFRTPISVSNDDVRPAIAESTMKELKETSSVIPIETESGQLDHAEYPKAAKTTVQPSVLSPHQPQKSEGVPNAVFMTNPADPKLKKTETNTTLQVIDIPRSTNSGRAPPAVGGEGPHVTNASASPQHANVLANIYNRLAPTSVQAKMPKLLSGLNSIPLRETELRGDIALPVMSPNAAPGLQASSPVAALPQIQAQQVAAQISAAVSTRHDGTTEVRLNPEELGRVRLTLTGVETGLVVTISAERPETQELMRRHIDLLTQEFRQQGYENPTFEFSDHSTDDHSEPDLSGGAGTTDENTETNAPTLVVADGLDLRL